jgi:hypothetical protein
VHLWLEAEVGLAERAGVRGLSPEVDAGRVEEVSAAQPLQRLRRLELGEADRAARSVLQFSTRLKIGHHKT